MHPHPQQLAQELSAASPTLDARRQRLAIALYRLLAEGEPVSRERLAERRTSSIDRSDPMLDDLPGVYLDDRGRVIGFWGMTLAEMPHRLEVGGRRVHAWCAWDTLFLPELIGKTVSVESTCPNNR